MFLAGIFLATAFPFTMVLLLNGRQGIHKEKQLDPVDYQVLQQMLAEDLSWMSDDTLKLLAVLYRTEAFCVGESSAIEQLSLSELYGEPYGRIYQAIESTSGMAVTIDGEYRELPFHKLSVGHIHVAIARAARLPPVRRLHLMVNDMAQEVTNFARFYTLFNKLPCTGVSTLDRFFNN